ncbi:MAG: hypothetical protein JO336_00425 [Acidobacteriia bacterium]|nr:hypothetical protein [Terriglobia bacterium]MBV8902651.1 hypothetical protein [Terriglobia bacterium]
MLVHNKRFPLFGLAAGILCLALLSPTATFAASWTLVNPAPAGAGTMLLLTDGTVMVQQGGSQNWMRLTPDATGNYANGTWSTTSIAAMSTPRLYYASQVLPSGKVWILGGEYTGPELARNDTPTGEIYDPIANSWTPITQYPNLPGCGKGEVKSNGTTTTGSNIITGLDPTATALIQPGWTVTGTNIPASTTVTSVDSPTQIHIAKDATGTGIELLDFMGDRVACFGAVPSILLSPLPNQNILAGSLVDTSTFIYTVATNSWAPAASKVYDSSDEEGWVKLSDGTILTYDIDKSISAGTGYAERYDPVANKWSSVSPGDGTALGTLPLLSSSALGHEFGPILRLQDGRAFLIGGNQNTALYTPSTNTWAAGPQIIGKLNGINSNFGADDAPGALLPNGHVLFTADAGPASVSSSGNTTAGSEIITGIPSTATFQVGWSVTQADGNNDVIPPNTTITSVDSPSQIHISKAALATVVAEGLVFGGTFSLPTQVFDFNPAGGGSISPVSPAIPDASLAQRAAFVDRMVVLPTGQVLFSDSSEQLYIYTGDGPPNPALRPVINNIAYNGGGTFTLTGKQLNGQSAGADYGDDVQVDSNYPVLRLVNSSGNVFYCRTTNWSSVGVGTSAVGQTVNFTLNKNITAGNYEAIVSGSGLSSFPVSINITQAEVNGQ